MAGSSSSISFILNKAAAASAFLHTTPPPPPLFMASSEILNPTMQNVDNSFNFNSNTSDSVQLNSLINGSSEMDWLLESNFTSNFTKSVGELLEESWLNVFDERYMRHSMAWTITLVVAYTLILIVGVIGNFMVILVVLLRPQMRSVTNMFIMNLAVADLFVIVFCVPATLLSNIFTPWILGWFMCKGVAYVQGVSVCASAYSLAAISLDRCKAIFRPFERPSGLSRTQAMFTTCLIWIIALMLTIPWAVVFNVNHSKRNGLPYCVETWENEYHGKLYFLIANFILCYCSPLLLISISNLAIWCHVTHRKVPQDSASAGPIKKMHKKARHGVLKMLGVVTLAFLISWLPLYVIVMRMKFGENISDNEYSLLDFLMPFAQWLGSTNSCINPVLYAFLNNKFREMFKSLLPSWLPCTRRNNLILMARYHTARSTATNQTLEGTNGTTSYTSVYTARSSGRSSRARSHRSQNHSCGTRSLVVSNISETGRASTRETGRASTRETGRASTRETGRASTRETGRASTMVTTVQTATTSVVSVCATSGTRGIRTTVATGTKTVTDL